jgi:long-chain acyl-CoA synthetase
MKAPNIALSIRREAAPHADRTAVIEGARALTYAGLFAACDNVAGALRRLGIAPRQRVGLLCEDGIEYVALSLAVLETGAVVIPLSPGLTRDETADIVERIDIEWMLYEEGLHDGAGEALPLDEWCNRRLFIVRREAGLPPPDGYAGLNPAFIRFSSGTTGTSKGVLLSHEAILERTTAADAALRITHEDVVMWVLSMSYHFVVTILLFLRRAAAIVVCHKPFPGALLDGLAHHRGTFIYASPFHYHLLGTSEAVRPDTLAGVRMAVSTAMNLPRESAERFAAKFGFELTGAYGIIEVGLPFVDASVRPASRGSVGRILPAYEVRIADADADGRGRIMLRGKGMFDAYFSPWQLRAEALEGGWFNTGDIGWIDADGILFIVGREKNVINFTGMKVFPYEVEEVLNRHSRVVESLVYPRPHELYGQLPVARVVPHSMENTDTLLAQLRRHCYRHLAAYKVPKEFEFAPELPRTASRKLVRNTGSSDQ